MHLLINIFTGSPYWNRQHHGQTLKIHFNEFLENICMVKFIYSEKATKFCKIFTLLLTAVHTVKVR